MGWCLYPLSLRWDPRTSGLQNLSCVPIKLANLKLLGVSELRLECLPHLILIQCRADLLLQNQSYSAESPDPCMQDSSGRETHLAHKLPREFCSCAEISWEHMGLVPPDQLRRLESSILQMLGAILGQSDDIIAGLDPLLVGS